MKKEKTIKKNQKNHKNTKKSQKIQKNHKNTKKIIKNTKKYKINRKLKVILLIRRYKLMVKIMLKNKTIVMLFYSFFYLLNTNQRSIYNARLKNYFIF